MRDIVARFYPTLANGCVLLSFLLGGVVLAENRPFIVKDGKAYAEIVIAEDAIPVVKLAAEDLRNYVRKMTGATLEVTTRLRAQYPLKIYVGKSAHTEALQLDGDALRHGAYLMKSGPNWLALIGRDRAFTLPKLSIRGYNDRERALREWDKLTGEHFVFPYSQVYKMFSKDLRICEMDERGSFNAVAGFLRMQGVRWYLPDEEIGEVVPRKDDIPLPRIDKTVRPDFPVRHVYQICRNWTYSATDRDDVLYVLRMGFNRAPDVVGLGWHPHGINNVHAREEVRRAHPEYYALYEGKRETRKKGAGVACLSSPGLFKQMVKYVRAVFDVFDAPIVSVMPQDGFIDICECPLCKGKGQPGRGANGKGLNKVYVYDIGKGSNYVWGFVNRVAREVYKTHPDRKVVCSAYNMYLMPPTHIKKFSPNVVVSLVQDAGWLKHDLGYYSRLSGTIREGYLKLLPPGGRNLIGYKNTYWNKGRAAPPLPFFFPHAIARDAKATKGKSLGDYIEVTRGEKAGLRGMGVMGLNLYVRARLWWDADQDVDALLAEYYRNFYGPCAAEMKALVDYSEKEWMNLSKDAAKLGVALKRLDRAKRKAPGGSVYARRIALLTEQLAPLRDRQRQLAWKRDDAPWVYGMSLDGVWCQSRGLGDIRFDGKIDDAYWKKRPKYSCRDMRKGKQPDLTTTFQMAWKKDAIYFGVTCQLPPGRRRRPATTRNDDTRIWRGDCVEILLETQSHCFYRLVVNPAGALLDMDMKGKPRIGWNSKAEVAAHVGKDFWSFEARIPVTAKSEHKAGAGGLVGEKPDKAFPWFFNLGRQSKRGRGSAFSSYRPTRSTEAFRSPKHFARLYMR